MVVACARTRVVAGGVVDVRACFDGFAFDAAEPIFEAVSLRASGAASEGEFWAEAAEALYHV
jgi:hypothetical protein